ncbi:hypothetical protein F8G81_11785 [Arthrobacter sp. CDRTa11]|uniref:hypothetical protein n=1 Tax=Arthrobacter sp. CDRTa11 TaxID=2651199 RepID=UPI002265CE59|nr:hypothetical protein [Arthrobacter sp. CDRTa11]UZX03207.1 hypothetical protein F8G81_11785 [Arthrobacter sp. CDRTa11]
MAGSAIKTEEGRGLRNDWRMLAGRTVEVWLLGEHILTGRVEQAAEDDAILWIAAEGSRTRKLFDKRSGYQVWA